MISNVKVANYSEYGLRSTEELRSKEKSSEFLRSVLKKNMCVVSKIENIVKTFICAGKKRVLYQMYAISNVR